MIAEADIQRMTVADRIETMERLWGSLAGAESEIVSPDWHGVVLTQRRAKVSAGEGSFLSLDAVRKRLHLAEQAAP